jgi:seryl-tRNA(Sec) selenium transferase
VEKAVVMLSATRPQVIKLQANLHTDGNTEVAESIRTAGAEIAAAQDRNSGSVQELAAVLNKPTVPVRDARGVIVGARKVDRLPTEGGA